MAVQCSKATQHSGRTIRGSFQQFGIGVIVSRCAAAQQGQWCVTERSDTVGRARWDTDGIACRYGEFAIRQRHAATAGGDVIQLLRPQMAMQLGPLAGLNSRFGQALQLVAMNRWVHQLPNDRAILGDIRRHCGVGLPPDRGFKHGHVGHGGNFRNQVGRVWRAGKLASSPGDKYDDWQKSTAGKHEICIQLKQTNFSETRIMDQFMQAAIAEAQQGLAEGGIPIGSVIVHQGRIIGRGHNRRVQRGSAILHGEMDAFENAGRQPATVYREAVLYTTLSPCSMCCGAILLYGIPRVVIGENTTFMGDEALLRSRGVTVEVLQDASCIRLMQDFIAAQPQLWNEDIGVD